MTVAPLTATTKNDSSRNTKSKMQLTLLPFAARIVFPLKAWSYFFSWKQARGFSLAWRGQWQRFRRCRLKYHRKLSSPSYEWQKRRDKPFNDDTTILTMEKTRKYLLHSEASKRKQRLKRAVARKFRASPTKQRLSFNGRTRRITLSECRFSRARGNGWKVHAGYSYEITRFKLEIKLNRAIPVVSGEEFASVVRYAKQEARQQEAWPAPIREYSRQQFYPNTWQHTSASARSRDPSERASWTRARARPEATRWCRAIRS